MGTKQLSNRNVDVAIESVYGQDPGSSRVYLLPNEDMSYTLNGERNERNVVRGSMSNEGGVITEKSQELQLPLEFRGAGMDAGALQVPETDGPLKASNMTREDGAHLVLTGVTGDFERGETVTNTTATGNVGTVADWDGVNSTLYIRDLGSMPSAGDALTGDDSGATGDVDTADDAYVYVPNSKNESEQNSLFVRFDLDGLIHKIPGCRGTFSVDMSQGQRPLINFTFSGLYTEPSDDGPISGTPIRTAPAPVTSANLILGGLDMSLVSVTAIQMDIGNQVSPRQDVQADDGVKSYFIQNRNPSGSINPDLLSKSQFNPWKDWSEANKVAVAAGLGSEAGNRVRIVAPETEITELSYSDRNGIATHDRGFEPTGDDNELMVIYS